VYFCFIINCIILFIGAVKPTVMVLVRALPISEEITNITLKYLTDNKIDSQLFQVRQQNCKHGQNIVGYNHEF